MLVILSGVAGAGKDTIKKELIKRLSVVDTLPSFTDRPQRSGDVPGKTYNFVSKEEFERMINDGELYEYNIHHNHYYGTSKKLLNEKINSGKVIVKDIEVNGTENLVKILKDEIKVVTIFLRVEKEELKRRLEHRVDKPDSQEVQLRLDRFDYEESKIDMYDYVIKNDDLEKTYQIIRTIIEYECKKNRQ